jgi:hypothetical protein
MTWVKGKHTFNFGGNYNLIKTFSDAANNVVANVNFGIAEGDPAEDLFNTANFPGASANDLADAANSMHANRTRHCRRSNSIPE